MTATAPAPLSAEATERASWSARSNFSLSDGLATRDGRVGFFHPGLIPDAANFSRTVGLRQDAQHETRAHSCRRFVDASTAGRSAISHRA